LDRFRAGELSPTADNQALLLESVDVLRELLSALREERSYPTERSQALLARLTAAAKAEGTITHATSDVAPASAEGAVTLRFKPLPHLLEHGNEPVRLLRELHELGSVKLSADWSKLPELRSLDPSRCYLAWDAEVRGTTVAAVTELFAWVEGDAELVIEPLASSPAAAPSVEANQAASPPAKSATTPRAEAEGALGSIRVAVDKIDLLMNMVGELVITQSMLGELDGDGPLDARRIERLREGLALLARNTRSLQESVMQLRSVPISVVFSRFPRLVHDLSRQLGKNVELHISGQSTELDKTILEKLGDPLVHLVRNSMDHGFESEDARRAAGKPAAGRLDLRAFHSGSDIVVEVQDDGKGIDRERVLARARELKMLGPDENPGDDAIRDFIFAPGFSTAKVVSDVSGRGVGMDVVRQN
ncbi:MAG TPA: ATP-binding protein, partial [Polyangiales bacterium]|nr:ATP-binding protein [Polyangiales bacterium]